MQANKTMNEFNLPISSHENIATEFLRAGKVDLEARIFFKHKIEKLNNKHQNI